MLESTFIFLKGVGEATERQLWEHGIENLVRLSSTRIDTGHSPKHVKPSMTPPLQQARRHLSEGQLTVFRKTVKVS